MTGKYKLEWTRIPESPVNAGIERWVEIPPPVTHELTIALGGYDILGHPNMLETTLVYETPGFPEDDMAIITTAFVHFPYPEIAFVRVMVDIGECDVDLFPVVIPSNIEHWTDTEAALRDGAADVDDAAEGALLVQLPKRCGVCSAFTHYGTAPSGRGWGHCATGDMNVSVNDLPGTGCFVQKDDGPDWAMGGSS